MTTPRQHAELAARLERLETTIQAVCQYNGGCNSEDVQDAFCDVVDELQNLGIDTKPPPIKRTITLTVNGREWVLPEPLKKAPEKGAEYWIVNNATHSGATCLHWDDHISERLALNHNTIHATAADAQAWSEFDKWCRGGAV